MAKLGMWHRDKKRAKLIKSKEKSRAEMKEAQQNLRRKAANGQEITYEEVMEVQIAFQKKLPRDAFPCRLRNRCSQTGRPRGYYRRFGICRNVLREKAAEGMLPGVLKSSW